MMLQFWEHVLAVPHTADFIVMIYVHCTKAKWNYNFMYSIDYS